MVAQAHDVWPKEQTEVEGISYEQEALGTDERPVADLSRLELPLCFASAVLTLVGIGSALQRIFS
ncbi:MAG: hypothetical protein JNM75_08955 [Rhodospirillales bacterium]|nr:hypothetical protein [Rhodospirillales bacterium]